MPVSACRHGHWDGFAQTKCAVSLALASRTFRSITTGYLSVPITSPAAQYRLSRPQSCCRKSNPIQTGTIRESGW